VGEIVGVNIGKTKVVSAESAAQDYEKSARLLGPFADYLVVNVSSPNTPGLRDLQAVSALGPILSTVRAALDRAVPERRVPLLVKIAPDLGDEDIDAVADLALELGLDGIVATNTTVARTGLASTREEIEHCGAGGLSGRPVKARSLEVLRRLRARVGDRLALVSVGGVESIDDVWERLEAGARLIQVYSAFVYAGPSLPSRLAKQLAERLRREGLNLEGLIGRGALSANAGSDLRTPAP
jgi:dihydroorotate dehydrogenase